ncbi:MAG: hypothetical protein AAFR61_05200 [Bacteroidota bacterium]
MKTNWKFIAPFFLSLIVSVSVQAQLKTHTVTVFKNGYAFVLRSGQVAPTDGSFSLAEKEIPKARFGTFWVLSPQGVKAATLHRKESEKMVAFPSFLAALQANVGKKISLTTEAESLSGTIEQVVGQNIMLKTTQSWISLKAADVIRWEFLEAPVMEKAQKEKKQELKIDFVEPEDETQLDLVYLQQGIGWVPEYLINLTDEDKAQLVLQASVMNEAEDLVDTDLNFVVGNPNFLYQTREGVLTTSMNFYQMFLDANPMAYKAPYRPTSQDMLANQQVVVSGYGSQRNRNQPAEPIALPPVQALEGKSSEDLYFYTLPEVSLPKGSRAQYTVLSQEIPIKHIYECRLIPNQVNRNYFQSLPSQDRISQVDHKIRLTNTGNQPWTTGSAMVSKQDEDLISAVSQDKLTYTSPGQKVTLKITSAPDILVKYDEEEIKREENAKRLRKVSYALVTAKGTIKVSNYKDKDLQLDIRRVITGRLKRTNPDWLKDEKIKASKKVINGQTEVCWEVKLEAGKSLDIEYEYEVYLPQ